MKVYLDYTQEELDRQYEHRQHGCRTPMNS